MAEIGKKDRLEILALLLACTKSLATLVGKMGSNLNSTQYSTRFNFKSTKKIDNLKYTRAPYAKNLSFYHRRTY